METLTEKQGVATPADQTSDSANTAIFEGLNTFWLLLAGLLPLLGLAPMLLVEAFRVWELPHYRFAPLPLIVAIILVGTHFRSAEAAGFRKLFGIVSVVSGCVVGVVSIYFFMPALAHLAAALTVLGWLVNQWGTTRLSRIASIVALIACTIPLPLSLDIFLIRNLQIIASRWTSAALDTFGIHHWLNGGVLSGRFFDIQVLRVAGGTDSVFFFLGIAMSLVAVRRHGWSASTILLLSVPIWSMIYSTIAQVSLGVYGNSLETYSDSLPFGIVRAISFGLVVVLIILFDIGLVAAIRPAAWSKLVDAEWLIGEGDHVPQPTLQTSRSAFDVVLLGSTGLLVLAGLMSAWLVASNYDSARGEKIVSTFPRERLSDASILPKQIGDWNQTDYRSEVSRSGTSIEYRWNYTRGLDQVQFVIRGAANLAAPWSKIPGWKISGEPTVANPDDKYSVVKLENPNGEVAYLLTSEFTYNGLVRPATEAFFVAPFLWRNIFTKLSESKEPRKESDLVATTFYVSIGKQANLDPAVGALTSQLLQLISQQYQSPEPAEKPQP